MRVRRWLVPTAIALVLASACTEEASPSAVEPTSAFRPTAPTGAMGSPTGPTGLPTGALPTGPPGAGTGNLSAGGLSLEVTGALEARKELGTLVSNVYAPPPSGMALVWTAGGTDATTVGLGGLSFTGTQATSPALSLSITVQVGGRIETFLSSAGECSVTIGVASEEQVAGTFTCSGLSSGGSVVDVEGVFRAQG